jgi:acyl-homoserine lactone acylase PvdQ
MTKVLVKLLLLALVSFGFFISCLWYFYLPIVEGTIFLENAPGIATISSEEETGIAHIKGESLYAAVYAQGY